MFKDNSYLPFMMFDPHAQIKMGDIFKETTISEATETSFSLFHDISPLDLQSELLSQINEMQIKTYRLTW